MRDDISIDSEFIKRVVAVIGRFGSCMLDDIIDHCDEWCMNTVDPSFPLLSNQFFSAPNRS